MPARGAARRSRTSGRAAAWAAPTAGVRSRSPLRDLLRRLHGSTVHMGERYALQAGVERDPGRRAGRVAGAAPPGGGDRELRAGGRAAGPAAGGRMIDLSLLTDGGVGWLDASGPDEPSRALDPGSARAQPRGPRVPHAEHGGRAGGDPGAGPGGRAGHGTAPARRGRSASTRSTGPTASCCTSGTW